MSNTESAFVEIIAVGNLSEYFAANRKRTSCTVELLGYSLSKKIMRELIFS